MTSAVASIECNICKTTEFIPGFNGRMVDGRPPMCSGCKSMERHRTMFRLYHALRPILKDWRVLQFAPDVSVDRGWFKEYVGSRYGAENSLNMMSTGLPDGRFDLVISNHVLEHVPDDKKALRELVRVVGPSGVVHVNVPTPTSRWETEDWGFADSAKNLHYRDYGADFPQRVVKDVPGLKCASVASFDPITLVSDLVYFFSINERTLAKMATHWTRMAVPITRIF
jgi:SAM-dependent methyltransferase